MIAVMKTAFIAASMVFRRVSLALAMAWIQILAKSAREPGGSSEKSPRRKAHFSSNPQTNQPTMSFVVMMMRNYILIVVIVNKSVFIPYWTWEEHHPPPRCQLSLVHAGIITEVLQPLSSKWCKCDADITGLCTYHMNKHREGRLSWYHRMPAHRRWFMWLAHVAVMVGPGSTLLHTPVECFPAK